MTSPSGTRSQEPGTSTTQQTGAAADAATLIRAPNHLGDFVLSLPALAAAPNSDILIASHLFPLAELIRAREQVIGLQSGIANMLRAARTLRRRRYHRVVLLPRSFSSALLARLAGIPERRGAGSDGRRLLLTEPVSAVAMDGRHRAVEYLELVTGAAAGFPSAPQIEVPAAASSAWRELTGQPVPEIAVFPGSNAPSRRWDPERFRRLVERLAKAGRSVVVLGGPKERDLTAMVAGDAALDLGGQTDLPILAASLGACRLLITNDSGPMHLAAAVGTPTISLWGAGDPHRTGPLGDRHVLLRSTTLPCISCQKNLCPRRGPGHQLSEARNECLALISEEAVWEAVVRQMEKWKSAGV